MTRAGLVWRLGYRGLVRNSRYSSLAFALITLAAFLMTMVTISQVTRDPVAASPQEAVFPAASAAVEYRPGLTWQQVDGLEFLTTDGQRQWQIGEGANPFVPDNEDLPKVLGKTRQEPLIFSSGSFLTISSEGDRAELAGLAANWQLLDPLADTAVKGKNPVKIDEISLSRKTAKQLSVKVGEEVFGSKICSANTCLKDRKYRVVGMFSAPHSSWQQFRLAPSAKNTFLKSPASLQNQETVPTWSFAKLTEQEKKYPYFIYSIQVLADTEISPEERSKLNAAHLRVINADDQPYWDFEAISFAQRILLFLPAVGVYLLGLFLLNLPAMTRLILRQRESFWVLQRVGAPPHLLSQVLAAQAILLGIGGSLAGVIVGYALQQIIISPDTGAPHIVLFFLALAAALGVLCCVLAMFRALKNTRRNQPPAKTN